MGFFCSPQRTITNLSLRFLKMLTHRQHTTDKAGIHTSEFVNQNTDTHFFLCYKNAPTSYTRSIGYQHHLSAIRNLQSVREDLQKLLFISCIGFVALPFLSNIFLCVAVAFIGNNFSTKTGTAVIEFLQRLYCICIGNNESLQENEMSFIPPQCVDTE